MVQVTLSAPNILTTGSLTLNGTQIMQLSDFANGVTEVDKFVPLLSSNTFSFSVAGTRGQSATLTVYQVIMPTPSGLTPNPLALNAGTSGTLTATLSPIPTAAGTLAVTSSNSAVASVPASVAFASGQSSVSIPVTAVAGGTGGSECEPDGRHTPDSIAKNSRHCTNQAIDIRPTGNKTKAFCCAKKCGAAGLGVESNHWHFQTDGNHYGAPDTCECKKVGVDL